MKPFTYPGAFLGERSSKPKLKPGASLTVRLIALLLFVILAPAQAQSGLSEGLDPRLTVEATEETYPGQDAVLLLDDITYLVHPDRRTTYVEHDAVKILSETGLAEHGNLVRAVDSAHSRIEVLRARTVKPDGRTIDAGPAVYSDLVPEGSLYFHLKRMEIRFPEVEVGDVVEFHIETTHDARPGGHFWGTTYVTNPMPIANSTFTVLVPEGVDFHTATPGLVGVQPEVSTTEREGRAYRKMFWQVADQPAYEFLPMSPPPLSQLVRIEVSSFPDWAAVADYLGQQWREQSRLPEGLVLRIAGWLPSGASANERAQALLRQLGEDRTVMPLLGEDPRFHRPGEVFQQEAISPNDAALLTSVALSQAGIRNVPVASLGVPVAALQDELPTPEKVQKIALELPSLGSPSKWVDPETPTFLQDAPPSGFASSAAFSWQDGWPSASPGQLVNLADPSPLNHREEVALEGRVERSGRTELTVAYDRYGTAALTARHAARQVSGEGREAQERALDGFFQGLARTYSQRARLLSRFFEMNPDAPDPFGLAFTIAVPNYGQPEGDSMLVPLPRFLSPQLRAAARDLGRTAPLVFDQPYQQDVRLHLIMPEGSRIEKAPGDLEVQVPGVEFSAWSRSDGAQFWYVGRLTIQRGLYDEESLPGVLSVLQQALSNEASILVVALPPEGEVEEASPEEDGDEEPSE